MKPSASFHLLYVLLWGKVTTTASCEAFCECDNPPAKEFLTESQPQPAVKPSVRLAFFYPYISGSARAFFPGGGQNRGRNGRFSTPSRKMAKWRRILPVFQGGYCCRFFSPPGHYQEMHSKRRRLSAPRPHVSRPCRQMMRTRSGSSGRSGGQAPKHAGLPASGSFQLRTKPLRMSSSSRATSNSLKPEHSPPRRHSARTSGRRPCAARWDAVATASCEAFCERGVLHFPPWRTVTTTASCEAFCEFLVQEPCSVCGVTTTASCEAFCEACLFLSIYFRQCKGLFSGRGGK